MTDNTTSNKKEKLTKGRFIIKQLRKATWQFSYSVGLFGLLCINANFSTDAWAFYICAGVVLGLMIALGMHIRIAWADYTQGQKVLDDMRGIFDQMRDMGKRAQWMQDHVRGDVDWNFDEQRAEVCAKTDDGEVQCLVFVEVRDDESSFEKEIIGPKAMDKCPVIVYQVPNDESMREKRTKWMRLGSGATMMQGLNLAFSRINEAARDVYDLKVGGEDSSAD